MVIMRQWRGVRVQALWGFVCSQILAVSTVSSAPTPCFALSRLRLPMASLPPISPRLHSRRGWTCRILSDEKAAGVRLVIPQTKLWVDEYIIGLNLCPFANEPFKKNTIRYAISDAKDRDELIDDCFRESAFLLDADPDSVVTTLLVAPAFAAGLQAWGDVGYWMEDYLDGEDEPLFEDKIAVVFFHPKWTFEELESEDPTHFERRAPFPTVSLLRKDDIGVIVKDCMQRGIVVSQQIAEHNTRILSQKGFPALSLLLKKIRSVGRTPKPTSK